MAQHGWEVLELDLLARDPGAVVRAATALYIAVIKFAPGVWRFLYTSWNRVPGLERLRRWWMTARFRTTGREVCAWDPDVILTTHPLATAIAARIKSRGESPARLVTVLTDWHLQPFWCFPEVDHYLATVIPQREALLATGIAGVRVTVTSPLVGDAYHAQMSRAEARLRLELPEDRPMVLCMGGGRGWGLEALLRAFLRLRRPASIVMLCGSEERRGRLDRILAVEGAGRGNIRLLGFVEPEPAIYFRASDLVVSKPSGLSLSQAFVCGAPVLASAPEPGHEEANLAELIRCGAVLVPREKEDLASAMDRVLNDAEARRRVAENARALVALPSAEISLIVLTGLCVESAAEKG